jgi:hypothetical protein
MTTETPAQAIERFTSEPVEITYENIAELVNLAERLAAMVEKQRNALEGAVDSIISWSAYADQYYQEKWNLQADIDAARKAITDCDLNKPMERL